MKKLLSLFIVLIVTIMVATSYKPDVAPKLYPEIEAYFKSVETKALNKEHYESLVNIKNAVTLSQLAEGNWNMIFYCSENTFRSQASQVFAETLCFAKRYRHMRIFSAGVTSGEISPGLIDYLTNIGYRITKSEKDGKTIYAAKFSDQADPVILYSKTTEDRSLPKNDVTSVIVCDMEKEADRAILRTESSAFNLAFQNITSTDDKDKVESILRSIAAEMVYITQK